MNFNHIEHDLFLLMLNLTQLRDPERVRRVFVEAVNSLWNGITLRFLSEEEKPDGEIVDVTSLRHSFGRVCIRGSMEHLCAENRSLLRNAIRMLAVILENRMQAALLSDEKLMLESLVRERTAQLVHANADLRREIAERIHAEKYLDNILNSSPSAIIGLDAEGRIRTFNPAAETLSGIPANQARSRFFSEILPEYAAYVTDIREFVKKGKSFSRARIPKPGKGIAVYRDFHMYPLGSETYEGAVIRIDDVTERVQFEEMMVQTEKMISVGGLAAGMAHEINNPLGGILQSVQNIFRRIAPELPANQETAEKYGTDLKTIRSYLKDRRIIQFLQAIRESGERAAGIVTNMLNFSRRSESSMAPANPAELVDRAVELAGHDYDLRKRYDFRQIEIIRDYESNLPRLPCTETEIEQVILNLLRNAAQAMAQKKYYGEKPCIRLMLRQEGNMLLLVVEDNGPGMEEHIRKRIFEPFFTTKEVGTGTGLGLSVSYFIIASNHRGTMHAESVPGQGTRFVIRLPLVRE
ncbi:MAG: ATP-binding protein [Desulfobacterales bacterium]